MIPVRDCLAAGWRIRRLASRCWLVEQHGAYLDACPSFTAALRALAARAGTAHAGTAHTSERKG